MLMPIVQGGATDFGTIITLSSDVNDYNLANDLTNNYGWNGSDAIEVVLNINSGVTIYSTSTGTPSIVVDLVTGSTLTINNSGSIVGKGGAALGGQLSTGQSGIAGGHAISMQDVTVVVNNLSGAKIQGGGGSAGSGGGSRHAGSAVDSEGVCQDGVNRIGGAGGAGAGATSATSAATTGSAGATGTGAGGDGGDFGSAGTAGGGASNSGCKVVNASGGPGGAAGKAIHHVASVSQTLNNSGTIAGATT